MNGRINDKIEEIEGFVSNLESYMPESFEEYLKNHMVRDACERAFEKIVEAMVDLAFITIKEKKLQAAEDDEHSFLILAKNEIISENLALKLSNAKGMRNILAHEYGEIDDSKVYYAIKEEIINDATEFIESIQEAGK